MTIDPVLTVKEVAELAKLTEAAVRKRSERGEIPGRVDLGRRCVRFKASAIAAWLNGGSVASGKGRESASKA